jgi:hypothetical protein
MVSEIDTNISFDVEAFFVDRGYCLFVFVRLPSCFFSLWFCFTYSVLYVALSPLPCTLHKIVNSTSSSR